jgi:hypothetical protein
MLSSLYQKALAKLRAQKTKANILDSAQKIENAFNAKPGTLVRFLDENFKVEKRNNQTVFVGGDDLVFSKDEILGLFSDDPNSLDRLGDNPNLPPRVEADPLFKQFKEQAKKDLLAGGLLEAEAEIIADGAARQRIDSPAMRDFAQKTEAFDAVQNSDVTPKPENVSEADIQKKIEDEKALEQELVEYESKNPDESLLDREESFEAQRQQSLQNLVDAEPLISPVTGRRWFGTLFKDLALPKLDLKFKIQPPTLDVSKLTAFIDDLASRARKAYADSKISKSVMERLTIKDNVLFKRRAKIAGAIFAGTSVASGIGYLIWALCASSASQATVQHQEDNSGCFLYNRITNTKTKVKLLTCTPDAQITGIETCPTQMYSATTSASSISECANNTFNPCAKTATSRSEDPAVPLVPNVCNLYLYKGSAPVQIEGVTARDACANLKANQVCSEYCKSENFNLSEIHQLMCIQLDYDLAFADLMIALGYDPVEIFPPAPSSAQSAVSKPLLIATLTLGVIFLVVFVYWIKK